MIVDANGGRVLCREQREREGSEGGFENDKRAGGQAGTLSDSSGIFSTPLLSLHRVLPFRIEGRVRNLSDTRMKKGEGSTLDRSTAHPATPNIPQRVLGRNISSIVLFSDS